MSIFFAILGNVFALDNLLNSVAIDIDSSVWLSLFFNVRCRFGLTFIYLIFCSCISCRAVVCISSAPCVLVMFRASLLHTRPMRAFSV